MWTLFFHIDFHDYDVFKLMIELLHSMHESVAFFSSFFPLAFCRNECASGCPENTTCEWGLCQCEDPEMVQIWGECVLPDDENLLHRNGTLSEEEIVGVSCLNDSDCQAIRTTIRGGICPCRQCRRQCKIFASGVNFSIFTHFLCFFLLKLLKLGEIVGVKSLA